MNAFDLPCGVYPDVPFDEYLVWPLLNASTLDWASYSMLHLRAAMDGVIVKKDSKDKNFGRALHCRLLEPKIYPGKYHFKTPCVQPLKSGPNAGQPCGKQAKAMHAGEWYCGTHAPKSAVSPENAITLEESQKIQAMWESVCNHDVVHLLRCQGGHEVSIIWDYNGTRLKSRVDKDVPNPKGIPPCIVDVKKTGLGGAADEAFSKAIDNYNYDAKAAMYIDALHQQDGVERQFVWVAVEDEAPYAVNVLHADTETVNIGRYKYRGWLNRYQSCLKSGVWPGYATDIHPGGLPEWRKRQYRGLV